MWKHANEGPRPDFGASLPLESDQSGVLGVPGIQRPGGMCPSAVNTEGLLSDAQLLLLLLSLLSLGLLLSALLL